MAQRKEEKYNKKLASLCDEISNFSETPLIDRLSSPSPRYKDFKYFNEGAAKNIFLCLDSFTGRQVAMAKLKKTDDVFLKERFLQEAQLTSSLQHPNIVPVYDLGLEDEEAWFTMKFISGKSLKEILASDKEKYCSPFNNLELHLDNFIKICDAISYAHSRGVLHLDLKPANIQIGNFGDLVVCDWGLANILPQKCDDNILEFYSFNPFDEQSVTIDGYIKGTPGYMAPEQASGRRTKKTESTDIFSLGAILYSILCFEEPFTGKDLKEITNNTCNGQYIQPSKYFPEIPKPLEAICRKAMAKDPDYRYKSVQELKEEIQNHRNGFATIAEKASLFKILKLWIYRQKVISSLIVAITILFLVGAVTYVDKLSLEKTNALHLADKLKLENEYNKKMVIEAAPAFVEKAKLAYSSFQLNDALKFCKTALELNPSLKEAWQLKGELHLINHEFNASNKAFSQAGDEYFSKLTEQYCQIKKEDRIPLEMTDCFTLIRLLKSTKSGRPIVVRFIRQIANSKLTLEKRLHFAPEVTKIMNDLPHLNFHYDHEKKHLDVSKNVKMETAIAFQNFPALSADFSDTGLSDFTSFRNQKLTAINISDSSIITLGSLKSLKHNTIQKLNISKTGVRNISYLKKQPIEELNISFTGIKKLRDFSSVLPKLKKLTVHEGQFTPQQIRSLNPSIDLTIIPNKY